MDFKLFLGVVKRYKRLVISGAVLAVALSVLSYGTPGLEGGKPTIIPRGSEVWQGQAELLISQAGFPYGRAVTQIAPGKGTSVPPEPVGDQTYMSNLSDVYAAMANGSQVQHQVQTDTHVLLCSWMVNPTQPCGTLVGAEVSDLNTGAPLPLVTLTSSASTAVDASKLATTAASVLRSEITQEQDNAGTPVDDRVSLQTILSGAPATLTKGHSKSIPMLVLFAVISASIALAFILNNHSEDPVRSTRERLDEGQSPDSGRALDGASDGRRLQPDYGWAKTGGAKTKRQVHATTASSSSASRSAAQQQIAAEEPSATDRHRAWSDRTPRLVRRASGLEPDSHN